MKKRNQYKKKGMFAALWSVSGKKDRALFVFLCFFGLISAFAVLVPTQIISIIISKLSGETVQIFGIIIPDSISYTWVIIVGAVVSIVMRLMKTIYDLSIEKLLKKSLANLRKASFDWVIAPRKNMDLKMTQGDALYRMNQTPDVISSVICDLFESVLPSFLSAIIAFIYIVTLDLWSMLILSAGILLVVLCVVLRTIVEKKISVKKEKFKSSISSMAGNSITNIAVINLFKSMSYENKLFAQRVNDFYGEEKKQINLRMIYWVLVRVAEISTMFSIIFLCAERIYLGTMLVGNIVIITNYVVRIFEPIQTFGYFSTQLIQASVSYSRLGELEPSPRELLDTEHVYDKKVETLTLQDIGLKNGTTFKIDGINLDFKKGEFVAISGESGCGKTTLIRLLCGLAEKSSGKIVVNGKDTVSSAYALVDQMSVSMQDAYIFNREAKLNILYPDGTYQSDFDPIIERFSLQRVLSRKYDESVDKNFENLLSGGERKRIGLTRALLKPANVYIFDEPTNDLDVVNAKNVIKSIDNLKKDAIVIVVSHDERVLSKADRVIKFTKTTDSHVEIEENKQ